jgi:hypothetical protein
VALIGLFIGTGFAMVELWLTNNDPDPADFILESTVIGFFLAVNLARIGAKRYAGEKQSDAEFRRARELGDEVNALILPEEPLGLENAFHPFIPAGDASGDDGRWSAAGPVRRTLAAQIKELRRLPAAGRRATRSSVWAAGQNAFRLMGALAALGASWAAPAEALAQGVRGEMDRAAAVAFSENDVDILASTAFAAGRADMAPAAAALDAERAAARARDAAGDAAVSALPDVKFLLLNRDDFEGKGREHPQVQRLRRELRAAAAAPGRGLVLTSQRVYGQRNTERFFEQLLGSDIALFKDIRYQPSAGAVEPYAIHQQAHVPGRLAAVVVEPDNWDLFNLGAEIEILRLLPSGEALVLTNVLRDALKVLDLIRLQA